VDFYGLFGEHRETERAILSQPFQLVNCAKSSDDETKRRLLSGIMEYLYKYRKRANSVKILQEIMIRISEIDRMGEGRYSRILIRYIAEDVASDSTTYKRIVKGVLQGSLQEEAMTIAESFKAEGLKKGIQQGMQQGMEQTHRHYVLSMHQSGMKAEEIAPIASLSLSQVQDILKQQAD